MALLYNTYAPTMRFEMIDRRHALRLSAGVFAFAAFGLGEANAAPVRKASRDSRLIRSVDTGAPSHRLASGNS